MKTGEETIAKLRALLEASALRPWTAYRMVHVDRGDNMTPEECGEYVRNSVIKSTIESGTTDFMAVLCEKPDGGADVCHMGNGPTSKPNAALIASTINAAWPAR